ncbi:MAG: hypothetical protein AB7I27_10110 [Bacteriovoracaceae bacterium]
MKFFYSAMLLVSLSAWAKGPFVDYFGTYTIEEIECTLNGEVNESCQEWKSLEIKQEPITKDRVCFFMRKANSTSSDCYKQEELVTADFSRKGVFNKIPNGEEFLMEILSEQMERNLHIKLEKATDGSYTFNREDLNLFPDINRRLDGIMKAKLKKRKTL